MRKYKTLWRLLAMLVAFGLVAAACGGDSADEATDAVEDTADASSGVKG